VFANKLTTAANTVFLQATNPLFVVALAPWLLRERVRGADLAFMGVLAAGLALLFVGGGDTSRPRRTPSSATCWRQGARWRGVHGHGVPLAGQPRRGPRPDRGRGGVRQPARLPGKPAGALPLATGRATDWLIVVYLGVFQLGLAYVFLSRAITRVPALEASLFLLVERC